MRISLFLFILLFSPLVSPLAVAEDTAPSAPKTDAKEPTRIETDSENGEIRFYIKGRLAAALKDNGLLVREDIGYGGTLNDHGRTGFNDHGSGAHPAPDNRKDRPDAQ